MNTSLAQLATIAIDAHRGTSFDPEKRGKQMIAEYESLLSSDLDLIDGATDEQKAAYTTGFTKHLKHYISSRGRIISPMIAGPSNFPTRRMEKYSRWERSAMEKFENYREKAIAGIKKAIERAKPQEVVNAEAWASIKAHIDDSAKTILQIDNGVNRYSSRPLIVQNLTGFITRIAKNGQTEHVRMALALIKEYNATAKKPIVTERNAIFKLVAKSEVIEQKEQALANRESDIYPFEGGQVIINYQEQRIQLKYDVPRVSTELYKQLTRELNFRHSPTNKAFQLYINNQSIHTVNKFLQLQIPYLK